MGLQGEEIYSKDPMLNITIVPTPAVPTKSQSKCVGDKVRMIDL